MQTCGSAPTLESVEVIVILIAWISVALPQNYCCRQGRHLGETGVYGHPRIFDTNFFTVNCTLIKRQTVLLLKEQYVTVGLVGKTMLYCQYFVIAYCKQPV